MKAKPLLRNLKNSLKRVVSPAGSVWTGYPAASEVDRERFERDMQLPLPDTEYIMYFTPRSGSTWVCDIATRTRRLGILDESFNPNFMPDMTRALNATDLSEYCAVSRRRRARGGVFGLQITHHQLRAVFGSEDAFVKQFSTPHCFWLVRRDIVLQAVSLYKMQVTKLAHAPHASHEKIQFREARFVYDGAEIRRWLEHILLAEQSTEALFAKFGLTPLRMSYEHNTTLKPNHLLNVMGRHMGLPTMRMKPIRSDHHKIATDRNAEFADRFRRENQTFLSEVEELRAPMLEKIGYYGPRLKT